MIEELPKPAVFQYDRLEFFFKQAWKNSSQPYFALRASSFIMKSEIARSAKRIVGKFWRKFIFKTKFERYYQKTGGFEISLFMQIRERNDPNGRWPAAKPLFGSFQVKRTLKLKRQIGASKMKRTLKW